MSINLLLINLVLVLDENLLFKGDATLCKHSSSPLYALTTFSAMNLMDLLRFLYLFLNTEPEITREDAHRIT